MNLLSILCVCVCVCVVLSGRRVNHSAQPSQLSHDTFVVGDEVARESAHREEFTVTHCKLKTECLVPSYKD